MKKVTGKEKSQDFTDDDLRTLMRDIERRENEVDAEFWDNAPAQEIPQNSKVQNAPETEVTPNSPEDLGFVHDDTEA